MLETLSDIVAEITNRLGTSTDSTFFTQTKIKSTAIDAYFWACLLYSWPMLETAKTTTSVSGQYYYDYPDGFITDSITRVIVGDDKYELKAFDEFLDYKHIVTGTKDEHIASDYNNQIFIYPTPTDSTTDIHIFGLILPTEPGDSDTTIFTDANIAGNEAIVKKATSVLLAQSNRKQEAQAEENEAVAILALLYSKIMKKQQKYQLMDKPLFDVEDMFGDNDVEDIIGNFE